MPVHRRPPSHQKAALVAASTSVLILLAGGGEGAAQADGTEPATEYSVDEAIGRTGTDPYMFYVFNRQDAPHPRVERSAPVVRAGLHAQSGTNR